MRTLTFRMGMYVALGLAATTVTWAHIFGSHRPYINWAPWDLAEYLVEHNRPTEECLDLIWFQIMSPTASEQRALCVFEYAELAKDPSACEWLMPSEYGLSCIGNTVTNEYEDRPDTGFFDFELCSSISKEDERQDWCNILLAHRNRDGKYCVPIQNEVVQKACILKFEAWDKYPELRGSSYFGKAASGTSAIRTAE